MVWTTKVAWSNTNNKESIHCKMRENGEKVQIEDKENVPAYTIPRIIEDSIDLIDNHMTSVG